VKTSLHASGVYRVTYVRRHRVGGGYSANCRSDALGANSAWRNSWRSTWRVAVSQSKPEKALSPPYRQTARNLRRLQVIVGKVEGAKAYKKIFEANAKLNDETPDKSTLATLDEIIAAETALRRQ
jgi:hypothetical protein